MENNCVSALYKGTKIDSFLNSSAQKKSLKVHSVFRRVINMDSDLGTLSIVTSDIGRMGAYLVISEFGGANFLDLDITKGSTCELIGDFLLFSNKLVIDLGTSQLWKGKLDNGFKWEVEKFNKENLLVLKAALDIYAVEDSSFRRMFSYKYQYLIDAVQRLCSFDSLEDAAVTVKNLIGFGPGLTPMGDDMLTGFLSAAASCSEAGLTADMLRKSILENLSRTNYVSSGMLQNAIDNIYHEYIQDLVYAVACENTDRIFQCTKRLLKIGATSGTDLATGIYLGFNSISQGKAR